MNIEGIEPRAIGSLPADRSLGIGRKITIPTPPPAPVDVKPKASKGKEGDTDEVAGVGEISNTGLSVAKGLVTSLESMLSGEDTINIQDLKDITSMLKDVFVMIEKYDKQTGGSKRGGVDDSLALFLSRRKA